MKKVLISDLDGTLALMGHRDPYNPKTVLMDQVNRAPADIIETYFKYKNVPTILVSGRFEKFRDQTLEWLVKNKLDKYIQDLYLRPNNDFRKDYAYKREAYEENIKKKYDVIFCLDDRDQSVKFWRSLGLTCLQVAPGNF